MFIIALIIIATTLSLWLLHNLQIAFLSPLSKIPNAHFTVPFSRIWSLQIKWEGRENAARLAAHEKLGPIVRIGPKELSINSLNEGIRTVYDGNFEKSSWYSPEFWRYGQPMLVSMRGKEAHSDRKRALTSLYTKSYIQTSPELAKIFQKILFHSLTPRLYEWSQDPAAATAVDVLDETKAYSLDVASAHLFGYGHGTNFLGQGDCPSRERYLLAFANSQDARFGRIEFYEFTEWLRYLGLYSEPEIITRSKQLIETLTLDMCRAAHEEAKSELTEVKNPLLHSAESRSVYRQLRRYLEKSIVDHDLLERKIAAEMLNQMVAGHETSSITLTYITYQLSKRPQLQQHLRKEIQSIPAGRDGFSPSAQQLESLPLLDALLMESLRILGQGPFPRSVPKGGTRIGDFPNIPHNTTVSGSAYMLHRNATVFPSPDEWKPERWLEGSTREMHRSFWAFGSGDRVCIARHLANYSIKLFIAVVYREFVTRVACENRVDKVCSHDVMDQADAFMSALAERKILLSFHRSEM